MSKVCFWGARPEANWKRPLLLVFSTVLTAGVGALFWLFHDHQHAAVLYVLGVPLLAMGLLGLMVAAGACRACVARMWGNLDIHA